MCIYLRTRFVAHSCLSGILLHQQSTPTPNLGSATMVLSTWRPIYQFLVTRNLPASFGHQSFIETPSPMPVPFCRWVELYLLRRTIVLPLEPQEASWQLKGVLGLYLIQHWSAEVILIPPGGEPMIVRAPYMANCDLFGRSAHQLSRVQWRDRYNSVNVLGAKIRRAHYPMCK